ncbi:tetratricopeptide repeat protein [Actinoplanes sp. NPDC049265]|uniref:CHAT domain-containing tetratricopeptide repeat protein n=1 Tax=Actinoplanes sp. NPDC049265 TaxID=3363902 RepID=UPI003714E866
MTDRLLIDLTDGGQVTVSVLGDVAGGLPEPGAPFPLAWAWDTADAEDLRWYLEDYLRAPYGVYQDRGERVAQRLTQWGQAAFGAVFDASRQARDSYVRLRAQSGPVEIVVRSAAGGLLGLPWELLTDPARPTPLALDGVRVRRALPIANLTGTFTVSGERLRVLMVISRPAGDRDVGYRMVARPLLHRLEAVRGDVDLVVLRPPTLDRLREVLAEARAAGQPFQVVHFDGHGAFTNRPAPVAAGVPVTLSGAAPRGVLVFEKPGGGADRVPADRIAAVLAQAQVPVVVLNACQSGALGHDVGAAVATRLLQQGAAAVVAMAFSVYAVAAAEFMTAFYQELFAGGQLADAVTAGRTRLAERNTRPSPKGLLPLHDWLVPVLYARQDVSFPHLHRAPATTASLDQIPDAIRPRPEPGERGGPLAAVRGGFVGRDGLFYDLEVATRLQKIVLLHGPGGTGKTELAKAFGRWWRDTGGVDDPDWVIWHSFEPGTASFGLPGILATIGLQIFGAPFTRLDDDERSNAVLRVMATRRLLLIWDNFESVYSMPDPAGATPPLEDTGRRQITDFLIAAATGISAVVITSRNTEPWLGDIRRIQVSGLGREEADEYTDVLLEPYSNAAARRHDPAFADLMTALAGHPLSMRVVLPHLDTTEPATIVHELRDAGGQLLGDDSAGRTTSLAGSIAYSYRHLATDHRQALLVLSLFHSVTDANVLGVLSTVTTAPEQFRNRTTADWVALLDLATGLGLVTALGHGLYTIHPALPAYLTGQWQRQPEYPGRRAATEAALLEAYATLAQWLIQQIKCGAAELALNLVHAQRHTLGAILGYALHIGRYEPASAVAHVLISYWDMIGLGHEARGWTDRIQHATETPDGTPPPLNTPAGQLWLLVVGAHASRQAEALQLDPAERTYRDILDMLTDQPGTDSRSSHLARTHHHLGVVAQQRGDHVTAEQRYRQSLTIREQLGDQPGLAISYHDLGRVTQDRGDLNAAGRWYRQSVTISEKLGDRPAMASTYHQLGTVAQQQGDLSTAEQWYRQALTIEEDLGDRPGMANSYHQLGMVAQQQGDPDTAEQWYRQALIIDETLGNRPGMASSYHQLGMVAEDRGDLDTAEQWYRQALTIKERLGNRPGMVSTYLQLGLLAEQRGSPVETLEWLIRCVTLFPEFPHPATRLAPAHLTRLTTQLGRPTLHQVWQKVAGQQPPPAVTEYIRIRQNEGSTT